MDIKLILINLQMISLEVFFFCARQPPVGLLIHEVPGHIQRRTTVGSTHLDE
jgi:hypothetical protein